LLASAAFGQSVKVAKDDASGELRALYVRFLDTSRLRNKAALDEIMTDDYTQVTVDGRIRTKAIRIQETMQEPDGGSTEALELKDFNVRFYSDAAVAICKVWEQYKFADGAVKKFDIWSTATFVRQKNKWRIAATHISMTELK